MSQPANDEFSQHLSDDEESNHEDASDTGNAPKQQQQVIPQTTAISNIKLLILKKEEYDIWAMEMEHYLEYIDNEVWKVIQNGNSKKRISTGKDGIVRVLSPVTAAEIQAIWKPSELEGLEKGYDRFQQLLSQLEAHGAKVSTEDANHKFLRSLPPAWSNLAMTMRTNPEIDTLSIDDLYNNLRVFEQENTSTCTPSTSSTNIPEKEVLAGFADEVIYSLFAKQSEDWDLLHEDLEQIDDVDIEEMDINWQIAMIAIRMKKEYTAKGIQMKEEERLIYQHQEAGSKRKSMGFQTMDDGIVNWGEHTEVEETNHALMAISSSNELGDQEAQILAYSQAVKKLEAQLKMAREAEVKRVVNTGNGVAKPVWTNANRVNHSNKFVPRSVQLNAGRPNFNSVRPNINTGRTNINSVRPKVNAVSSNINTVRSRQPVPNKTSNSLSPKRPQMNQINQRRDFSKSYSSVRRPFAKTTAQMSHSNAVMGIWGSAVKTSASYNWRNSRPNFNYNSGPTFIRTEHPLKNMVDRGIFDSGCSGHMTGNKDQLEDFEEFNGGSVTFGGSKGYISGKGKIRVDTLSVLGKFDGKSDEGFLVGYSLNSKAYRVYNLVTKRVEVNLHVNFLEDKPNVKGVGYRWMFDIDYLTDSMNYIPVSLENQANPHAGILEKTNNAGTSQTPKSNASEEKDEDVELIVVPSTVRNTEGKAKSRKSSINSKKEEILTELQ
ncbi:hypothetical protein Tco_0706008 [Tanacetum coccineum]|uniref:Uncharacterized protein n=1 Tax=Tanacetum coccineum TaxID=301880 RepID=A0ABQ4Y8A7_9ASTR